MSNLTALIDGDILIYQSAAAHNGSIILEGGEEAFIGSIEEAKAKFDRDLDEIVSRLRADRAVLALSDDRNFRKGILPTYKSNRKAGSKPKLITDLREHCAATQDTWQRPTLEGDDVLGILATSPTLIKGEKVIVSLDKDMRQIPGLNLNLGRAFKKIARKEAKDLPDCIEVMTQRDADFRHMRQTLTGDAVDGYGGCRGIGPTRATKILDAAVAELCGPQSDVIGVNEYGEDGDEFWMKEKWWQAVVETYEAKGFAEEDALVMARCSRILRNTDYDFTRKEPILWVPPSRA